VPVSPSEEDGVAFRTEIGEDWMKRLDILLTIKDDDDEVCENDDDEPILYKLRRRSRLL
jgi:hypothetical protein